MTDILQLAEQCRAVLQSIIDAGAKATARPWRYLDGDSFHQDGECGGIETVDQAFEIVITDGGYYPPNLATAAYICLAANHAVALARRELGLLAAYMPYFKDMAAWQVAADYVTALARELGVVHD